MALFFMAAAPAIADEPPVFRKEPLTIRMADGRKADFTVEVADDETSRQRGLMFRKTMAADAGMLFDFGTQRRVQMWMENTILPLDMLFLDDSGTVKTIRRDAVPYSRDIIDSKMPVAYVVELNAGTVDKLGITTGDSATSATIGKTK